uniref:Uncharacterized protein n=1 Tax=Arundo donax TaxID=35708 RepID=A0A0A8Z323_ARUDO
MMVPLTKVFQSSQISSIVEERSSLVTNLMMDESAHVMLDILNMFFSEHVVSTCNRRHLQ